VMPGAMDMVPPSTKPSVRSSSALSQVNGTDAGRPDAPAFRSDSSPALCGALGDRCQRR
jgi:hypothetical protein